MNVETQTIHDDGDPKKYWTRIYNMADDDLDPYEYRLLGHYIRWGGTEESLAKTAKITRMGKAKVIKTRQCLQEKGYIKVEAPTAEEARKHQTVRITLIDRWAENMARYTKTSTNQNQPDRTSSNSYQPASTNQNQLPDGTGTNQNPMKNNRKIEEQSTEEQLQSQTPSSDGSPENRLNIFRVYEENIGALTSLIADELKDMIAEYGEILTTDAIKESVLAEKRNLKYVRGTLRNWKRDGRSAPKASVPPADITHSDQDPVKPSEYIVKRKADFKRPDLKKTGTDG